LVSFFILCQRESNPSGRRLCKRKNVSSACRFHPHRRRCRCRRVFAPLQFPQLQWSSSLSWPPSSPFRSALRATLAHFFILFQQHPVDSTATPPHSNSTQQLGLLSTCPLFGYLINRSFRRRRRRNIKAALNEWSSGSRRRPFAYAVIQSFNLF